MGIFRKHRLNKVLSREKILRKFKIFDMSIYSHLFNDKIIYRGEQIYKFGNVNLESNNENDYKFCVKGTDEYHVNIRLNVDDLEDYSCTCPYFSQNNEPCKHIYACLYSIKVGDKIKLLNEETRYHINKFNKLYKEVDKFLQNNDSKIPEETKDIFFNSVQGFSYRISSIERNLGQNYVSFEDTISKLNNVISMYNTFKSSYNEMHREYMYNLKLELESRREVYDTNKNESNISLGGVLLGALLSSPKEKSKKSKDYEYDYLDDYQKDLVKKGFYDSNDFAEDDDMEPDNYFYDEDEERKK